MPRKMVVIQANGASPVLTEILAESEAQLQDLVKKNPDLLPVDEFGMGGPLMVVGRETTLRSGAVDLVCLATGGELLVVEFKTGPQNADFRHALAQLLDYGADLWRMTAEEFESTVAVRYFAGADCQDARVSGKASLDAAMTAIWPDMTGEESAAFRDRLGHDLAGGALHFVLAAQRFTPTMQHTIEFANATAGKGAFYAVEVVRFAADGVEAFEARTILKPEAVTPDPTPDPVTVAAFLEAIEDQAYRASLAELFDVCRGLKLRFGWGAKGTSIRLPTADRPEPLTVAWIFPSGGVGFMGLSDLNLGFDPRSAEKTPSVAGALEEYVAAARDLSGAEPVTPAGLRAYHLRPAVVVRERYRVADILAQLTRRASGDE